MNREPWRVNPGRGGPQPAPALHHLRGPASCAARQLSYHGVAELRLAKLLTPELIESLQTLNAAEIRLDAPIGDSEDSQLVERFINEEAAEPEQDVEGRLLSEAVRGALDTLEPRDAKVLRLYFGLDGEREHTLEEIGNMLGVTRERIRQLRDRALRRLREGEKGDALESFAA